MHVAETPGEPLIDREAVEDLVDAGKQRALFGLTADALAARIAQIGPAASIGLRA